MRRCVYDRSYSNTRWHAQAQMCLFKHALACTDVSIQTRADVSILTCADVSIQTRAGMHRRVLFLAVYVDAASWLGDCCSHPCAWYGGGHVAAQPGAANSAVLERPVPSQELPAH